MTKTNEYFKQYKNRITSPKLVLPSELWSKIEQISEDNIDEIVSSLQIAVSNGFMGVAAEISDLLEASSFIDNKPAVKIAIELERMKRLYYMGFKQPTLRSSNKVIELVTNYESDLSKKEISFFKSVAHGYTGWLSNDSIELNKIISKSKYSNKNNTLSNERDGFTSALKGHYYFLKKDEKNFHKYFIEAIEICENDKLLRSLAYIKIIYAEHLSELDNADWKKSILQIEKFINRSPINGFHTHLLIRAIILYLKAPNGLKNNKDINAIAFRYHLLVYSMGLTPSQDLYPLLRNAKLNIPERNMLDPYQNDMRIALSSWIEKLEWKDFEKLLKTYYEFLGYKVEMLPDSFPVFDLIASCNSIDGIGHNTTAIQVKHWKNTLYKKDLPESNDFKKTLEELDNLNLNISELSSVYWYLTSSMHKEAKIALIDRVKLVYGSSCRIEIITGVNSIVELLLNVPEILPRIVLSDEWEIS